MTIVLRESETSIFKEALLDVVKEIGIATKMLDA